MAEKKKSVRSRKWLLTCNNPHSHGWDYARIENILSGFKTLQYACWCTERGLREQTEHFHLFLQFKSQVTDDRIHKAFERTA